MQYLCYAEVPPPVSSSQGSSHLLRWITAQFWAAWPLWVQWYQTLHPRQRLGSPHQRESPASWNGASSQVSVGYFVGGQSSSPMLGCPNSHSLSTWKLWCKTVLFWVWAIAAVPQLSRISETAPSFCGGNGMVVMQSTQCVFYLPQPAPASWGVVVVQGALRIPSAGLSMSWKWSKNSDHIPLLVLRSQTRSGLQLLFLSFLRHGEPCIGVNGAL